MQRRLLCTASPPRHHGRPGEVGLEAPLRPTSPPCLHGQLGKKEAKKHHCST
jgi:hypothetical protein